MKERIENVQKSYELSSQQVADAVNPLEVTVEAAIALKFSASISPNRGNENKPIENADLPILIRSTPNLDNRALSKLGDLVYSGGGKELVSVVEDVRNGKPMCL